MAFPFHIFFCQNKRVEKTKHNRSLVCHMFCTIFSDVKYYVVYQYQAKKYQTYLCRQRFYNDILDIPSMCIYLIPRGCPPSQSCTILRSWDMKWRWRGDDILTIRVSPYSSTWASLSYSKVVSRELPKGCYC